jgi:hypothetical protein
MTSTDLVAGVVAMKLAGKPAQRPADVLDFVPVTKPWAPTPAYRMPAADVAGHGRLCERGHLVVKGLPCRGFWLRKPRRGGWGCVCPGAR